MTGPVLIDPRSIFIAMAIGNLVFGGLAWAFFRADFRRDAVHLWIAGRLALGAGWGLIALRGVIADFWTIPVAASLSLFGVASEVIALRRKCPGATDPIRTPLWVLVISLVIYNGFWVAELASWRVITGAVGTTALFLLAAWPLWQNQGTTRRMTRFLGAANALMGLSWFSLALLTWSRGYQTWVNAVDQQILIAGLMYLILLCNGFGFLTWARERSLERLTYLATTDGLTGLLNRATFVSKAEQALALNRRLDRITGLMAVDLDHFKAINDRLGHTGGDQALVRFADTCRAQLRSVDLIGRMGGEEFAVLLPDCDAAQTIQTAERLRQAVEPLGFTISIGADIIHSYEPLEVALNRCDRLLYQAKTEGRNRIKAT